MTLTQLGAFVLVAQLGSVRAAADVLGVSEPAVSQALSALRTQFDDQLIIRDGNTMVLTPGGSRLLSLASQMVALGAEAQAAVRSAKGAPTQIRLLVTSTIAEFIATPLMEAFVQRWSGTLDATSGVASTEEMRALLPSRLADAALGPDLTGDVTAAGVKLVSEPILRCSIIVVAAPKFKPYGSAARWPWLVDASGTDPDSDTGRLLARLRVPEAQISVFPNQTLAWAAAADGLGVAPAVATLVAPQLRRGELCAVPTEADPFTSIWYVTTLAPERRGEGARRLRAFLSTPDAMQLMCSPGRGVPPSRFRPPVYVTIWS
jgi:LysR family transcriptional regulator, low CO2-responsive transcriptional regulator